MRGSSVTEAPVALARRESGSDSGRGTPGGNVARGVRGGRPRAWAGSPGFPRPAGGAERTGADGGATAGLAALAAGRAPPAGTEADAALTATAEGACAAAPGSARVGGLGLATAATLGLLGADGRTGGFGGVVDEFGGTANPSDGTHKTRAARPHQVRIARLGSMTG